MFSSQTFSYYLKHASGLLSGVIFCIPILIYAVTVICNSVNIPFYDDYELILSFLVNYKNTQGFNDSLNLLLTGGDAHNGFFAKLVYLTDTLLNRHLNFIHLIYAANICLLGILILFYISGRCNHSKKIFLFLPVSFLLFQLQYWEISTWAVAAMVFLPTFLFSLLTLFLLNMRRVFYMSAAYVTGLMAAISAGHGLFVFPAGFALLLMQRRMKDLIMWSAFSLSVVAFQVFLYTIQGNNFLSRVSGFSLNNSFSYIPIFLASVGTAVGLGIKSFSIIAGLVIVLLFLYITLKKYYQKNPVMYFFMIFLLLINMAIALTRSSEGIDIILFTSRHRIVSILLLIVSYISLLELLPDDVKRTQFSKLSLVFAVILFSLSYFLYLPFLNGRYNEVKMGVNGLLHNNPKSAYNIIRSSERNDIYIPPPGFLDNISPDFKRNENTKLNNFVSRFNKRSITDTTFTMRINIPPGNILGSRIHIFLQKPEVIYLFNSGLTPTTIRETLHNVNPDDFSSDIYIKKKGIAIGKDGLNVDK